jgi:hypothetical protein
LIIFFFIRLGNCGFFGCFSFWSFFLAAFLGFSRLFLGGLFIVVQVHGKFNLRLVRELAFEVFHVNLSHTISTKKLHTLFLFGLKTLGADFNWHCLTTSLKQVAVLFKDKAICVNDFDF